MYKIISYYNFVNIKNSEEFCAEHKLVCQALGVWGRIYIAQEGINGTISASEGAVKQYERYISSLKGFEDILFKEGQDSYVPFDRLIVKTREEIVSLKCDVSLDVQKDTGRFLEPKEWRSILESNENYYLIDVRNSYETKIGHFKGAILPEVENFFDFPKWLNQTQLDKKKKVLMYCTGGIRCEKFSGLMKQKGFEDVSQLHGGILKYSQEEKGAHYTGKCFIFDDRLAVKVDEDNDEVISKCEITNKASDTYLNCANPDCNKLFICSEEGATQLKGCCSEECLLVKRKRPFDQEDIYAPSRRWHTYFM